MKWIYGGVGSNIRGDMRGLGKATCKNVREDKIKSSKSKAKLDGGLGVHEIG